MPEGNCNFPAFQGSMELERWSRVRVRSLSGATSLASDLDAAAASSRVRVRRSCRRFSRDSSSALFTFFKSESSSSSRRQVFRYFQVPLRARFSPVHVRVQVLGPSILSPLLSSTNLSPPRLHTFSPRAATRGHDSNLNPAPLRLPTTVPAPPTSDRNTISRSQ